MMTCGAVREGSADSERLWCSKPTSVMITCIRDATGCFVCDPPSPAIIYILKKRKL